MQSLRHSVLFYGLLFAALLPSGHALSANQPAVTQPSAVAPEPEEKPVFAYLTPASVAYKQLPQPPKVKSKAWKTDIGKIIQIQKYAAPHEIAAARYEHRLRPEIMTDLLGPNFTRVKLPKTFSMLDNVVSDSKAVTKQAKDHWHLPRPYRADKRVKLLVPPLNPKNFAYPSGHTSTSLVLASLLGSAVPDARFALQHQAGRIANRRVLAGVHTPHDLTGGRVLGALIWQKLQTQPAFQADFAAAREEIAASDFRWTAPGCPVAAQPAQPARKNWKSFKSRVTE